MEKLEKKLELLTKSQKNHKSIPKPALNSAKEDDKEIINCNLVFSEKYSIDLPLKTVEEFTAFEENLRFDEYFRRDFVSFI